MYGGAPPWGTFTPSGTVAVRITDTGDELRVAMGTFTGTDPDGGKTYETRPTSRVVADAGTTPLATIRGTAGDLDTWLWKRDPALTLGWDGATGSGSRATGWPRSSVASSGQPLN